MSDLMADLKAAVEATELAIHDTTANRHDYLARAGVKWDVFAQNHGPALLRLLEAGRKCRDGLHDILDSDYGTIVADNDERVCEYDEAAGGR